jgi:hypothetical protein
MNNIQKRFLLFLFFCIGTRCLLVFAPIYVPSRFIKPLCVILGLMGFGFLTIFFLGLRKTGIETGGQCIWWDFLRPVHGILFLSVSYQLWKGCRQSASQLLFVDVCIGLIAFLFHHFIKTNNFAQLK